MSPRAYYNERDPYAAQWLRNLVAGGLILAGDVDERDIRDVAPGDLVGYTQHHFFAGIGVWSYALRLAGWADERPVVTGSCPCQPFSAAGRGGGFADQRHLWPAFFHLIRHICPSVVFGEQVASDDGLFWLDLVSADMEGEGYALGAADLCAAGEGAPHIRQRLFFVGALGMADAAISGRLGGRAGEACHGRDAARFEPERLCDTRGMADADDNRRATSSERGLLDEAYHAQSCGDALGMGDASGEGLSPRERKELRGTRRGPEGRATEQPSRSFWADADWIECRDGVWRPIEPGSFPLAHGAPSRVGRLRAYGNAISPFPAARFVKSYLDIKDRFRRGSN